MILPKRRVIRKLNPVGTRANNLIAGETGDSSAPPEPAPELTYIHSSQGLLYADPETFWLILESKQKRQN